VIKPFVKGVLYYVPGVRNILQSVTTGGSDSARYCYSVWMRHLVHLYKNGMKKMPEVVAEIGPGDSLGIGLCALLSGADVYYAFDIIKYSNLTDNRKILVELTEMFRNRTDIPDNEEFPELKPRINDFKFPDYIFNNIDLDYLLCEERLHLINSALEGKSGDITIKYVVPWQEKDVELKDSVDLIFSQAVMEHIDDINNAYTKMFKFLKPNSLMTHEIDFKAHETHNQWNGHLGYTDKIWKVILNGRLYSINRKLLSEHLNNLKYIGFNILDVVKEIRSDGIQRDKVADKFKNIPAEDFETAAAFVVCRKSGNG
jgi:SAM-dependent methyltransferase